MTLSCTSCGGTRRFDPSSGVLTCEQCGLSATAGASGPWDKPEKERDLKAWLRHCTQSATTEEVRLMTCPNCSVQLVWDGPVQASPCPFCAASIVESPGKHRQIKPQSIVPFALDEDAAVAAMKKWLSRLWRAPKSLASDTKIRGAIHGMYLPFWTFDATAITTGGWYQRNSLRSQLGQAPRMNPFTDVVEFDDLLIQAVTIIAPNDLKKITPWDLTSAQPYRASLLAGFECLSYTVGLEAALGHAMHHIEGDVVKKLKATPETQHVSIQVDAPKLSNVTFKQLLLPVWIVPYQFRGEQHLVLVNGQTGEAFGTAPVDNRRATIQAVGIGVAISLLVFFLAALG